MCVSIAALVDVLVLNMLLIKLRPQTITIGTQSGNENLDERYVTYISVAMVLLKKWPQSSWSL